MLAILLLPCVISSSTASLQCPVSLGCSCPDYTRATCTGYLTDNFTNLLDSRLRNLTLRNTNITEVTCATLPEGIEVLVLFKNRKLKNISFSCDRIRTIRQLEISAAEMSELYPITEQYLDPLTISDNRMLQSLQKLYLSNLRIRNHTNLLLQFFSNVTELQLNRNEISPLININPKLPSVKLLDLSNNPIKNISAEFFRSMANLKTLQLEWTKLTSISRDIFHPLKKLAILRLDGNNLTSFENDTFLQLNNLWKLRLSKNQINYFQSALTRNLTNLKELYLNDNNLTELEQHVFDSLVSLRVLDLTHNRLKKIYKTTFKNQKTLLKLYLGWNRLEKLEAATLAPLRNLLTLNLEGNQLTFLEERTFETLSMLKLLNLAGNLLINISGVQFPQGAVLQKLLLQRNSLENIDPVTFRSLEDLESLRLDGNNFRNINVEIFDQLDNLKYLNLSECNMFNCSCPLEELWQFCMQRNITLANGAACNNHSNHSIQWSSLKICSEKYENEYVIIIIIVIVLVIILVVFFAVVRYLLKRARSKTPAWCPQNSTTMDNSINPQNTQASKEEDYDFVPAEVKAEFSKSAMARQEDYVEPTVSKVILPISKPMENPRKAKRRKVSIHSEPVFTSSEITIPQTIPESKAPAAPPEDLTYMHYLSFENLHVLRSEAFDLNQSDDCKTQHFNSSSSHYPPEPSTADRPARRRNKYRLPKGQWRVIRQDTPT